MINKNKNKSNKFSYIFAGLTFITYLFVGLFSPDKAMVALDKSLEIFLQVLPILLVVLLLTALLNTLVNPKMISKYLGKESGIKGWIISIFAGVLSHGSTYIWYPVLKDFREHGVKEGLIVAFMYARAIKLPWLPMLISYFGLGFTLILSLYILLAAFIQGLIADKLLKAEEEQI